MLGALSSTLEQDITGLARPKKGPEVLLVKEFGYCLGHPEKLLKNYGYFWL